MNSKVLSLFTILAVVAFAGATEESQLNSCTNDVVCKDFCVNRGLNHYYCLHGKCQCGDGKSNVASVLNDLFHLNEELLSKL